MISVLHVLDASASWEQRLALRQLLDHAQQARIRHCVISIGPAAESFRHQFDGPIRTIPALAGWPVLAAPFVARAATDCHADVIHAWGTRPAMAARSSGDRPIVVERFDPRIDARERNLLRTIAQSGRTAFACAAEMVRRRLVEGGVPDDRCVVIRPGVDFNLLNRARRERPRECFGLSPNELIVTAPVPAVPRGGQREAFLAACFAAAVREGIRFILPGDSPETRRIRRLAGNMPALCRPIFMGDAVPAEVAIALADVMVVAPEDDASMTAVAWAFGAGAAVVAVADYAVTELVVAKVNGLLFKRPSHESPAVPAARLILDTAAQRSVRETARGQAYEIFGVRRSVEQHMRLYENLLSGSQPESGITDSAAAG